MAVAVDITSTTNDCVPSYIHARSDRRLYWLPAKRPVVGRWPIMKPFIESWERAERVATQALLCQSRGSESSELCSHCKGGGGVFDKCVALRNEYNNRCANCVFSQRRDWWRGPNASFIQATKAKGTERAEGGGTAERADGAERAEGGGTAERAERAQIKGAGAEVEAAGAEETRAERAETHSSTTGFKGTKSDLGVTRHSGETDRTRIAGK
ncbi:uncharacterized protein LA080_011847 [Diaporthe eres]|nr:uncharacterized protein LA080_011847 [Diaporthe eres]